MYNIINHNMSYGLESGGRLSTIRYWPREFDFFNWEPQAKGRKPLARFARVKGQNASCTFRSDSSGINGFRDYLSDLVRNSCNRRNRLPLINILPLHLIRYAILYEIDLLIWTLDWLECRCALFSPYSSPCSTHSAQLTQFN